MRDWRRRAVVAGMSLGLLGGLGLWGWEAAGAPPDKKPGKKMSAVREVPPARPAEEGLDKELTQVSLRFTPENVPPGGLFQFEASGKALENAAEVTLICGEKRDRFRAFRVSGGLWRGYGALRLSAEGKENVRAFLEAGLPGGASGEKETSIGVASRDYPSSRLKVAPKFTSLSASQKRRTKEDQRAFAHAYAQDELRPLFSENFVNPRGTSARVTSVFGGRRVFNGRTKSRHLGLDLDGSPGDPVYAAADGVVRMRRDCFYAGGTLVVGHGAGIFTSYFHLSRFHAAEGDAVKKGQLIGEVGKSGRVTGPHLHFGAKVGGVHIDPQLLLEFGFFPESGGGRTGRAPSPDAKAAPDANAGTDARAKKAKNKN